MLGSPLTGVKVMMSKGDGEMNEDRNNQFVVAGEPESSGGGIN